MEFVSVETFGGNVNLIIFPKVLNLIFNKVNVGQALLISGKASVKDDDTVLYKEGMTVTELAGLLMDHWRRLRTDPPTISVSNDLTIEELKKLGMDLTMPTAKQMLKGFRKN